MMTVVDRCFVVLLVNACVYMTSQQVSYISVIPVSNKRLDVTPRDVETHGSVIKCTSTCRATSWCVSINIAPDRSTWELLSVEVADVTSLVTDNGWLYVRKCHV